MNIKGKNMVVWADGAVVSGARTCTLNTNCELQEICSPSSGEFKEFIKKKKSWSVQSTHIIQTTNSNAFTTFLGKKVYLKFAKSKKVNNTWQLDTTNPLKFEGYAIVSKINVTADKGNLCEGTFEFTGTGTLTAS